MGVSCGTSNTGSNEDSGLSVLDLLLQQDNFGDFDSDGISDDFGVLYPEDAETGPDEYYPDGTCVKEISPNQYEGEKNNPEKGPDDNDDVNIIEPIIPTPPVPTPIKGCTNPKAENYDSKATEDDGSCIIPTTPPIVTPPNLSKYAEFLTPRSKETANAEAGSHKGTQYFVPTSYKDFNNSNKGPMNGKYLPTYVGYYDSPGDGSEGYFKWIETFNLKETSFWIPAPRPFYIATKYWRNGGYDDRARQSAKTVGCGPQVVKDGMYTAGKCSLDPMEISVHTTGIGTWDSGDSGDPLRHSDPHMGKTWSAPSYHWMLRNDGWCSQILPDWRYGCGVGSDKDKNSPNYKNLTADKRNVGITWMTYKQGTDAIDGGYPRIGVRKKVGKKWVFKGRAVTVAEFKAAGDFTTSNRYRNSYPSDAQIINMGKLCAIYIKRYKNITIAGHHQYKSKSCPNFWVPSWVAAGGIPGLDQAGIDKFIKKGGTTTKTGYSGNVTTAEDGFCYYKGLNKYGEDELMIYAAQKLAEISNPAGIGGGSVPFPNSNTSNPNIPVPAGKLVKDMDCNEFKVYYDANWKNISPGIRTGRMNAMSPEDQEDLIDKTRDCI